MIRKAVVFTIGICVAFAVILSLGDLIGFEAWARFDALGLSAVPVGIGLLIFSLWAEWPIFWTRRKTNNPITEHVVRMDEIVLYWLRR